MKVPFVDLKREAIFCKDELLKATELVINSGYYISGPHVKEFEENIQNKLGVKHAISVGNGSDSLSFAMKALGIKEGDEVICPANSFIATAWAIANTGATPVFCDVDNDMLIDIEDAISKISRKTKAIIPVHLTGRVVDINKIRNSIPEGIKILEDAAQSFNAHNKELRFTGTIGDAGSFSLHPLKNLAIYGDGGIVTTNDDELADKCRLLRNHGLKNRDEASIWGYNSRLDELQAAYALIKLKHIEEWTSKYIDIAKTYDKGLYNHITKPEIRDNYRDVYHNYVIRVPQKYRDLIMRDLAEVGVETKIHYPIPLHLQECSSDLGYKCGSLLNTENFAKEMISLPIYPFLTKDEVQHVIDSTNNVIKRYINE